MDWRLVNSRGFGIAPEDLADCPINHLIWPELMAQKQLSTGPQCIFD
jgi:hypothetical protein